MCSDRVPVVERLADAAGEDRPLRRRLGELREHFAARFGGAEPEFCVRVPGRVNLIGEHIDYCGYPVLPMALEQDVIVAVRTHPEPILKLTNLDPKYADYEGPITALGRTKGGGAPKWHEYVLCGIVGGASAVFAEGAGEGAAKPLGLQLAVSGNVPASAGLSSSSALVCSAALAFVHAHKFKISKQELANLCARSERLIGTEGGGMDQAIAFMAKNGCAQYITWNPLATSPVMLPSDAAFVVAHSLAEANKAATNDYNDRVKECTIAAQMVAQSQGLTEDAKNPKLTLATVQKLLDVDLPRMRELVARLPQRVGRLKIRDRAAHVIDEALRVDEFRSICANGDGWERALGRCMRASHASLRELFECSHPLLDELVRLSDEFGVAARLTGAGWGGCIVALCAKDKAPQYVDMLIEKYYGKHPAAVGRNVAELVFVTGPKQGAYVFNSI